MIQLTFLGATETVTGSKYLLTLDHKKILIDCGLFQGPKELRLRNWDKLPVAPSEIDAVFLTHAHLDHSGYLPLLVKNGFRGKIYSTQTTRDLCGILLPDSGHLQEEEAEYANKKGYSKHKPAVPLYTEKEALETLRYFEPIQFDQTYHFNGLFKYTFRRIGHIIGAACLTIQYQGKTIVFSGDLGPIHNPIAGPPESITQADYLIVESTYGNRSHERVDSMQAISEVINRTIDRGGVLIIPAFVVGRTQLLLYYLYQLQQKKAIPEVPIYLDSPSAIEATSVFCRHPEDHALSPELVQKVCAIAKPVDLPSESYQLDLSEEPKIIISASGMATGGRVLHHLKKFLPNKKNTVLFVGYQAERTRGHRLISGEKEIKIHGQKVPVNAEIVSFDHMSAHADYQGILNWLSHFAEAPQKIFITHGEPEAASALQEKINAQFHFNTYIPKYLETVTL